MKHVLILLTTVWFAFQMQAQAPRIPLVEHFTNTVCSNCSRGNPILFTALDDLGDEVVHISYHSRTPYTSCVFYQHNRVQADARRDQYNVGFTPQAILNGTFNGGGNAMMTPAEARAAAQGGSPISLDVQQRWIAGDTLEVGVKVDFDQTLAAGDYDIFVTIVEKTVNYNAPNGEQIHRNVFRAMLPNDAGEALPVLPAGQSTGFFTYKISDNTDWVREEMQAVAFVQNRATGEVINAGKADLTQTGLHPGLDIGLRISPNPASSFVNIAWSPNAGISPSARILNAQGQTVLTQNPLAPGQRISIDALAPGIYIVQLQTRDSFWTQRIIKQ